MFEISDLQNIWRQTATLHAGQRYRGSEKGQYVEYLYHIGAVTFEVLTALQVNPGMNAKLAVSCALLHDSIEDTDMTFEQVRAQYGSEIAAGVLALTKDLTLAGKRAQMLDSLARIKQQPEEIWAVKMADRICNLSAPPHDWPQEKTKAYLEEAQLIHTELKEGNAYLAERLEQKIEAYVKYL